MLDPVANFGFSSTTWLTNKKTAGGRFYWWVRWDSTHSGTAKLTLGQEPSRKHQSFYGAAGWTHNNSQKNPPVADFFLCFNDTDPELQNTLYNRQKRKQYPLVFRFFDLDKKFIRFGQNARQRKNNKPISIFD